MSSTNFKGEYALTRVLLRACEKEVTMSRPVGEGCRYDLVMDEGTLSRVQVKFAGGQTHGSIVVRLVPSTSRGKKGKKYTEHEADLMAVYSPVTDKVYMLPASLWRGKTGIHLRYKESKNNQKTGCFEAADWEW